MPINFYTPTFRQQVNPIDLNVLARTYNTLEQGHQQAIQTKSQIDAQLAQLDLNEAEDAWRQEQLNKVRNALTENMQYGNAYSSLDDIVGTYGDITSSPGMIGRLRAQQDYKAYMDNLDKRTDLSEDYKNYYRTVNKYNYQDITDKNGNVIGGSKWTPIDKEVSEILNICKETKCKIKKLPGMYQFLNDEITLEKLKDVEVQDLLGRDPVQVNLKEIMGYVKDKVVMVTGGGGSIGSELCRQIAASNPKQLIIVDIYENNAYNIQLELQHKYPNLNLETMIASVRDAVKINDLFAYYKPDIVYHAAAHKHVPLMEDAPHEAIKNNVFGTLNVAKAADQYGVKKFILISTDKAVNPTNIMGASKRLCEMIVQSFDKKSKTEFVAVRFGNVLGSNGSVIPLFKKTNSKRRANYYYSS